MKTTPLFYFQDEPQFCTKEFRHVIAHKLRTYRKPSIYRVKRVSTGRYHVSISMSDAVAVITTRGVM